MQHYTDALSTYRNCLNSKHSHVDIGVTLNNIGQIHRLKGNYAEAMKVYQESFRIMKSILGLEHRNVAATPHNMATMFLCQEEYDNATELFQNVLIVQRGALGDDHLDVAITLDSMGHVYERRKKFDKAFKLYSKSLRVRKAALGKHHLFVAVSADRIANFLRESGHDSMEALRHFSEALEVYVANDFEESHPELVGVKLHIAALQKKSSDSKQAEHAAVAVA
uniref:Kinesin light chain n=1 Tax=Proboscia inermis TaxID=420281 RepID=A0A7S0BXS6_9STRA|mmetsp:Transcript_13373/g.13556  ORF Transcript_13373/g.13556 Transcript_13373/m.13556 type:complete len:223 (+) Transcript_13373:127-795(+)